MFIFYLSYKKIFTFGKILKAIIENIPPHEKVIFRKMFNLFFVLFFLLDTFCEAFKKYYISDQCLSTSNPSFAKLNFQSYDSIGPKTN